MGLLGAHVSAAGGVQNAPQRGSEIFADSIQIFTANQNQWTPKEPTKEQSDLFQKAMQSEKPKMCVSHASYLLNIGSPEEKKLTMSRHALLKEIDRCDACGIPYVVFHPGAHMDSGEEACLSLIVESLNEIIRQRPDSKVKVLIENTAGQGSAVGYRFRHLASILEKVKQKNRVGICFDTQHAFAAGYDIRTLTGWNYTFDHFDRTVGLKWLKVFHINDSKKELGKRVDRHEKIGKGFLTIETFWCLVNDERFSDFPMILETPVNQWTEYTEEIKLLRSLRGAKKPK